MSVALIVLTALLGVAAAGSAVGKLRRVPQVVASMRSVGVNDGQMQALAGIELLGALGLLVGAWVPWLGVAAALGFTLYFLGAVGAHVRAGNPKDAIPALALLVLAIATLVLQLGR